MGNDDGQNNNGHDDLDPTEEVGPEESEVLPQDTEFPPQEGGQQHEQVQFLEELGEAYKPEPIVVATHPDDGLPYVPEPHAELAIAPPFTYENVVCVEDARQYIEIFEGEDGAPPSPDKNKYIEEDFGIFGTLIVPDGHYFANWSISLRDRYDSEGKEKDRKIFDPKDVVCLYGYRVARVIRDTNSIPPKYYYIPVRPIRPQCIHYKRQMFLNDDQSDSEEFGNKIVFRNCAVRTSVGGASMSLRDQAVLACEWRSPPDLETTRRHLDIFDQEKLNSNAAIKMVPLFGNKE